MPPLTLIARSLAATLVLAALPLPRVPYTLIAGTAGLCGRLSPFGADPNDGVVAVSETHLGGTSPELFPAFHTLLMDHPAVRVRILTIMSGERAPDP